MLLAWFPLESAIKFICKKIPSSCEEHSTRLIWGFPHGEPVIDGIPNASDEEIERSQIKHAFPREFCDAKKVLFPHTECKRDHYSFSFPTWQKDEPWPYCAQCIDAETKWFDEKRRTEEIRKVIANKNGWASCPWCNIRFDTKSSSFSNKRHQKCGHRIELTNGV